MGTCEQALELWRRKNITTNAELAEALNSCSSAFAYCSEKIENDNVTYNNAREIFEHDGVTTFLRTCAMRHFATRAGLCRKNHKRREGDGKIC